MLNFCIDLLGISTLLRLSRIKSFLNIYHAHLALSDKYRYRLKLDLAAYFKGYFKIEGYAKLFRLEIITGDCIPDPACSIIAHALIVHVNVS